MKNKVSELKKLCYDFGRKSYTKYFNTEDIWIDDYFDDCVVFHVSNLVPIQKLRPLIEDVDKVGINNIAMIGYTMRPSEWLGVLNQLKK